MNKREIAIASVLTSLGMDPKEYDPTLDGVGATIVDNLIRDGIISLAYAGDPDISMLIDTFQMAVGNTATIKTDRYAAARLGKRYGSKRVAEAISKYGSRRKEKYAPVVNNLTQFEQKWPQIERFINEGGEGFDV